MKTIEIGNKEYTFEFTIEASLYSECTEKVTILMTTIAAAQNDADMKAVLTSFADIPQTALTMFYAGLIEHHGEDGDGTVLNKKDAKKLVKQYFVEHKEDETGNFYGILELMLGIMSDDDFFGQIGLTQMAAKSVKIPQDHKRKSKTGAQ